MNEELNELREIKKLLILLLRANKVSQEDIARTLGVRQPAISKLVRPEVRKVAK